MSDSEKCPTKRPIMSDEISHSQQTMNQDNKISYPAGNPAGKKNINVVVANGI